MSNIVEIPERELSDEEWVRFFQKIEFEPATEADSATAFAFCKPPSPEEMCDATAGDATGAAS